MRYILTLLCALMSYVAVVAQTQQHSIIIDEQSFKAVQVDRIIGVGIDKIPHDNSNRPCARIKMHVNRMTRAEIDGLKVYPVGGSVVVMKQTVAAEGNGLIIELTAKEPTRFYLHHDKYGDSNEVSLNLEGNKEYTISAQLNILYPIFVSSDVVNAEVYIDNIYVGRTNERYTLTVMDVVPGFHKLRVQHGNSSVEKDIEVSNDNLDFRIEINHATSLPQYVIFEVSPKNAVVVVDKKSYLPDADGMVMLMLSNGSYNYQVSAKDYHTEKDTIVVSGSKVEKEVKLNPAFGWLSVASVGTLQGATIFVDDNLIGITPINRLQLASGEHSVRIVKDMYETHEGRVTIADNTLQNYTVSLVADYATVTLNAGGGSDIYVNGAYKGKSTWCGDLATGTYLFEARKESHRTTTLTQVIKSTPAKQSYTLDEPMPILGTLDVVCSPVKVDIYVDDKHLGSTPMREQMLIGKHKVTLRKEGYKEEVRYVTIEEDKVADLMVSLTQTAQKSEPAKENTPAKQQTPAPKKPAKSPAKTPTKSSAKSVAATSVKGYQSIVFADADMLFGAGNPLYLGIEYIGGCRINRGLFLGLGVGVNINVIDSDNDYLPDHLYDGKVYQLGNFKMPLYLYGRGYLGSRPNPAVQPFLGVAAGYNISFPTNVNVTREQTTSLCRFFGEFEFGLNIKPKNRKALFVSLSCPIYCTPKYVVNSRYEGKIVNGIGAGISLKFGASF